MPRPRHLALAAACALALVAAACSDDGDGTSATTAAATSVPPTPAPASGSASTTSAPTSVASTVPATTAAATTAAPTTPAPKIAAPDTLGPYEVGRRTLQVDSNGRTVDVDVWYPVARGATGTPSRYTFLPGVHLDSEHALDAVPVATESGPFPLVVYSHGSGGLRYISASSTELLASHGFVVAAPDHVGNTAADTILGTAVPDEQNMVNRLTDVSATIDLMLAENDTPGGAFESAVDPERIALVGHSAGGATVLATESGVTSAVGSVPADERIDAIVAWAPVAGRLTPEQLAMVDVPVLYVGGTKDDVVPIDPNIVVPWNTVTSRPAYRVDLSDGGHQSFTDVCRIQDHFAATPGIPEGLVTAVDTYAEDACVDGFMPIERAHQLIDRYTVSFLEYQLNGSDAYLPLLTSADGTDVTVEQK